MAGALALLALLLFGVLPAAAGKPDRGPDKKDPPGHQQSAPGHGNGHDKQDSDDSSTDQQDAAPDQAATDEAAEADGAGGATGKQDAAAAEQSRGNNKHGSEAGADDKAPDEAPVADGGASDSPGKQDAAASESRGQSKQAQRGNAPARTPAVVQPEVAPAPAVTAQPQQPAAAPAADVKRRAAASKPSRRAADRRRRAQKSPARGRAVRPAPRARTPLATTRWVPAPAAAPVASSAAPASAPKSERPAPERDQPPQGNDADGVLQVVPIVFNALSETVAFVPAAVWAVIGGLALLALGLLGFTLARERHVRALGREREALIADLEALESAVVPALPEALGGLALSVTSSPTARPATGGDFHDAFPLSQDRVAVLVGDVAGSGRKALSDAQLVRHAVRAYLEAGLDPRAAIAMTGAVVDERDEPLFASVIVAVHDRRNGTLTFASAGHEPPILVSEHGAGLPPVSGWSPPLGAGLETGRRQTSIPLPEGTALCLLTDGLTEARSRGERIGISRIIKWLSALGPGAMSSDVVTRLYAEAEPEDDVTVCMLRALTPSAPSTPRIEEAVVEGGDPTYLIRFLRDCGLPLADAEEAGEALAAMPDGTRVVASVEIRGGRAVVELAPLRGATTELVY